MAAGALPHYTLVTTPLLQGLLEEEEGPEEPCRAPREEQELTEQLGHGSLWGTSRAGGTGGRGDTGRGFSWFQPQVYRWLAA